MLVPRRAARSTMLKCRRRRTEAFPNHRQPIVPLQQPQLLLARDDEPASGVGGGVDGLRLCLRARDDVAALHDFEVRDATQGAEVELVRERHREVRVLHAVQHQLPEGVHKRGLQSRVRAELCEMRQTREERAVRRDRGGRDERQGRLCTQGAACVRECEYVGGCAVHVAGDHVQGPVFE